MTDLLSIEYPHWLMIVGALLLVLGVVGLAFRQRGVEAESHAVASDQEPSEPEAGLNQVETYNRTASYAGFWVTGRSGGVVCRHVDDLDAVVESDTCNHLRQLICAFEPPPGFRCGDHQLEHHQPGGR